MFGQAPQLRLELEPDTYGPRHVRRAIQGLDLSEPARRHFEDALLLTSELVANAIIHSSAPFVVSVWCSSAGRWRVEVDDASTDPPLLVADPSVDRPGGRGLRIVAAIATSWGTVPTADGKRCWFELQP